MGKNTFRKYNNSHIIFNYKNRRHESGKTGKQPGDKEDHMLIPVESLEVFMRDTVDLVKADFDTKTFAENPRKYITLYLAVGRQNPGIYIRAFRDMTVPYFDMSKSLRRDLCLTATFPEISHLRISRYGLLPSYYNFLEEQIETGHYFLLMQPGISIWLMVIGIGVSINRKNKEIFLCILPIAIYFIGLLLGPMALLRYLYPMMLATPLLLGILFWSPESPRISDQLSAVTCRYIFSTPSSM